MIKNYKQYLNEGLLNKLEGPSKKEVEENIRKKYENGEINIFEYYKKSKNSGVNGPEINKLKEDLFKKPPYMIMRISTKYGILDGVKKIIDSGYNIHTDNDEALYNAVVNDNKEIVKYLIEHGANIHVDNEIALKYAINGRDLDYIKYLIEHGADIHFDNDIIYRIDNLDPKVYNYLISLF